jgi:SAM-dependent methyltransferase
MWLDPMPLAEDLGLAYASYYTHQAPLRHGEGSALALYRAARRGYLATRYGYSETPPDWKHYLAAGLLYLVPTLRVLVDFSVMWLSRCSGGRLLDVGCGSGVFLKRMQELGWRVEGVESDPQAARRVACEGIPVHVGDLAALKLKSDGFDAVTMSHLIEHVADPLALLRECHRILKPGGRMVVVTPNSASLAHRLYRSAWMHLDPPRHLHLFNSQTLARLAELAGFVEKELWTSPRDAAGVFAGSRCISRAGRHDMAAALPLWTRLWAHASGLGEWLLMRFAPGLGEDAVLVARK